MDDKNIDTFAAKENWEVELTIDMNKVFAPVTMQSLAELLENASPALAKAGRAGQESQAEHQQQYLEHDEHQGGGFNSGMNTMMNGLR